MKLKTTILLVLISISITSIQCEKDSADQSALLSPITTTGANTFGCLMNGLAMLPKDGVPTFNNPYPHKGRELVFDTGGNIADFNFYNARDKAPLGFFLDIHLVNFSNLQPGDYKWQQSSYGVGTFPYKLHHVYGSFYDSETKDYAWFGSYDSSGTTTITRMDTINHIISGTFSGKLKRKDGAKEIAITDGRFDIKWRQ